MALAIALIFFAIASSSYAAGDRVASDEAVTEAENMIERAGKSDPVDSKLIHAAMDKLHEAIRLYPRNDSAYVDLGFCYGVLRDGDTAVAMYHTATELNPSGSNFIELADIYLRVGDPEDALLAANAGLIKDPSNARLYNAKGMALNDLQRFGEAQEAWEKALKINPDLKVAQVNLDALNGGPNGRGSISKHSQDDRPLLPPQ
jgi:tetratricopeptide (TPR) repeat protein